MTPTQQVEEKAKEMYEASRRKVSGRPAWDKLDRNDPYDEGMRLHAIAMAQQALTAEEW